MEGSSDVLIPWHLQQNYMTSLDDGTSHDASPLILQRYYHLFTKGELEQLVYKALPYPTMNLVNTTVSYDHENWYVILGKTKEGV
jgi:hypothetical protein